MNLSKLLENFLTASQRLSKLPEASQRRPDPEPTKGRTPNPQKAGPRTHKGPDPEPTKGRTPNPQKADKNPKFQGAKTEVISILKNARFTRSGAKS